MTTANELDTSSENSTFKRGVVAKQAELLHQTPTDAAPSNRSKSNQLLWGCGAYEVSVGREAKTSPLVKNSGFDIRWQGGPLSLKN